MVWTSVTFQFYFFRYGIMDAGAMVREAKSWTPVLEQKSSAVNADIGNR